MPFRQAPAGAFLGQSAAFETATRIVATGSLPADRPVVGPTRPPSGAKLFVPAGMVRTRTVPRAGAVRLHQETAHVHRRTASSLMADHPSPVRGRVAPDREHHPIPVPPLARTATRGGDRRRPSRRLARLARLDRSRQGPALGWP